jgi:hypothetical protein
MTKQEFDFFGFEHVDETTVVIKISTVCGGSATPFVGIGQLQSSGQIAKETGTEQQAHTSRDQLFAHFSV